jgi:hypothetical protein
MRGMNAVRQLVAAHAAGAAHRCFLPDARSERSLDFAMLRTATQVWYQQLDAAGLPPNARVLIGH